MSTREKLLGEIEAFLVEFNMSHSTFGKRVMNDGKFVARLRKGADLTLGSADNIRKFMEQEREKPRPSVAASVSAVAA